MNVPKKSLKRITVISGVVYLALNPFMWHIGDLIDPYTEYNLFLFRQGEEDVYQKLRWYFHLGGLKLAGVVFSSLLWYAGKEPYRTVGKVLFIWFSLYLVSYFLFRYKMILIFLSVAVLISFISIAYQWRARY